MMNRTTVVGVFRSRDEADRAIDELHRMGFSDDAIGFAWRKGDAPEGVTEHTEDMDKAGKGLATGAVVGGIIGAAAALLIPGVGPVIAGGLLAPAFGAGATAAGTAAAGAALGAATGGLIGVLTGMGVPEDEARYYESEFHEGRIVVTVRADGRYEEARSVLRRFGAYDVENRPSDQTGTTYARSGATTVPPTDTPRRSSTGQQYSPPPQGDRTRPFGTEGDVGNTVKKPSSDMPLTEEERRRRREGGNL